MNLDRRKLVILGVLLAIAAALIIWWSVSLRPASPSDSSGLTPGPGGNNIGNSGGQTTTPTPIPVTTAPVPESQSTAIRLSRLFVERFGTFTSQGNFEDIADLALVASSSMRQWMQTTYVPDLRKKYPSTVYVGQTTQVLGTTVEKSSDTSATILVRTQQKLTEGSNTPIISNRNARLTLIKEGDAWIVDSLVWLQP